MTSSYDAVVVGAGVIGLSIAWRASSLGLKMLVLDRGEPGAGASRVAAGMLAPITEAAFGEDALLRLNLESARRYPAFLADLGEATGQDLSPATPGTIFAAFDRDQLDATRRLHDFQRSLGLGADWLTGARCRELEPALHPGVRGGVLAAADRDVDPRTLLPALLAALRAGAGEVRHRSEVAGVEVRDGRVAAVRLAGGGRVPAGTVVLAAGCWSGGIAGVPGHVARAVRPVKGQILRLRPRPSAGLSPEEPLLRHVVRSEEVYLVPRRDGEVVAGATVEEQGFEATPTAGGVYELLRAAVEAVPGVREMELAEVSAGLRPGSPDNAPLIGPAGPEGLIVATGHFRNGILLAPVTADAVAAWLAKGELPPEVAPFAPERFAR